MSTIKKNRLKKKETAWMYVSAPLRSRRGAIRGHGVARRERGEGGEPQCPLKFYYIVITTTLVNAPLYSAVAFC